MAPWKCPDCGTWWSGLEHRCPEIKTDTTTNAYPHGAWWERTNAPPTSIFLTCNCTWDEHGERRRSTATCPIHDVQVFYTGWGGA